MTPCAAEPQVGLADDDTEKVIVRAIITVHDPLLYVMSMVPVVVVTVVPVVVVTMAIMTIMSGMNPVPLVVEEAVDLCPFGPEMIGLVILAPCFGTVCLVFEAVLDAVALTVQVPLNSFTF